MVKQGNLKYMTTYMRDYRIKHANTVARTLARYYVKKNIHAFQSLADLEPLENMINNQKEKILVKDKS